MSAALPVEVLAAPPSQPLAPAKYVPCAPILAPSSPLVIRRWSLLIASLSAVFFLLSFSIHIPVWDVLSVYALFAFSIVLLMLSPYTRSNPLHPLSLIIFFGLLNYGIRALEIIYLHSPVQNLVNPEHYIAKACFLTIVSFVLLFLGFHLKYAGSLARQVPLFAFPVPKSRLNGVLFRAFLFFLLTVYANYHEISLGVSHFYTSRAVLHSGLDSVFHEIASYINVTFLAFLPLFFLRKFPRYLIPGMMAIMMLIAAVSGSSTNLVMPLALLAIVFWLCRKPLAWPKFLQIWLFLILALAPLVYAWRYVYYAQVQAGGSSASAALSSFDSAAVVGGYSQSVNNVLARFGRLDMLLLVLKMVPSRYPFQFGNTFMPYLVQIFMPRILYAHKKIVDVGTEFRYLFQGLRGTSNISLGFVGETFFNFGYFGMALAFPVGMLIRFFWDRLLAYSRIEPMWAWRLYFVVFLACLGYDSTLIYYFATLLRGPLVLYLIMMFVFLRLPKRVSWKWFEALST